jgi:hypothetical protein
MSGAPSGASYLIPRVSRFSSLGLTRCCSAEFGCGASNTCVVSARERRFQRLLPNPLLQPQAQYHYCGDTAF